MNSIIMSIRPEWVAKILNGEKTIEVRKHALKEGDEVHIYCTKAKPWLQFNAFENQWELTKHNDKKVINPNITQVNGKVVAKFIVGKVRQITHDITSGIYFKALCQDLNEEELLKQSCLRWDELEKYLLSSKNDIIYALSITHLEIFDKPRELREYYIFKKKTVYSGMDCPPYVDEVKCPITRAPQSYCHAWVEE